jgi:hypothetical protein
MPKGRVLQGASAATGAGVAICALASPVTAQQVTVAPLVQSSIGTRSGTEAFSGSNLVVYRAGTPADGGGFEATVDERPDSIFFRNGVTSLGAIGVIASSTRLEITLANDTPAPLIFRSFESVIIPAGFGFYTAVVAGACSPLSPTACGSVLGPAGSFANLVRPAEAGPGDLLGRAGFAFRVLVDGVVQFDLASSLALEHDPLLGINRFVESFGAGPSVLSGWRLNSAPGDPNVIGYAWDTTSFTVDLGGRVLAPGETQTITYLSSVFAESYAIFPGGLNALGLLGYSAFGDPPVGRPGGGGSLSGFEVGAMAGGVERIEIGGFTFVYPYWDRGRLFFPPIGGVIPEPATWAMMIAGFGLVGGMARRRRLAGAGVGPAAATGLVPPSRRHPPVPLANGCQERREIGEPAGDEVDDLAFALDHALDPEHRGRKDETPLRLEQLRPDDEIGLAGLVFQRDEHHPLGRARLLADEDDASTPERPAIARLA